MHLPAMPDTTGLAGSVQACHGSSLQDQMSSCLPLVVLLYGSSMHLPETGLYSSPAAPTMYHCWLVAPVQLHSWSLDPLAVPRFTMSRHLPWMTISPASPGSVSG